MLICPFVSFDAFGNPSRSHIFFMSVAGRFPGLLTWLYDHSSHLGMQNLRQNKNQGRIVARKLVDSKRRELKDGMVKKDALSLLGSLLLPSILLA